MKWRRWLKYGKAKIDQAVHDADAQLDRKEEQLAAERAGRPWLTPSGETPTLDEVKARIEDRAATAQAPTPTSAETSPTGADAEAANLALEMEAQRKAAEERLAEIRKSLDLPAREDDTH